MIVVTGAAGFIGSVMVGKLNNKGFTDIVPVDDFSRKEKERNLENKAIQEKVDRDAFFRWLEKNYRDVDFIFHLGARTDTTEFDMSVFDKLNLNYSKKMWEACSEYGIPLVYASSAATYGLGELGYDDRHDIIPELKPLNPYGVSKNEFDKWVLRQSARPPFWAGLKFFNVYGPNEFHKGRMASVIFHAYNQIRETGKVKLFRSHRPDFEDGMQLRDFIYVKDVANVMHYLMTSREKPGIYNLGTGKARAFLHLAEGTFRALNLGPGIEFIDTPEDIRDKYQYFTEARMEKLFSIGYTKDFYTLEEGIEEYVQEFLLRNRHF
jgi:ADP-L-glycero-D-manno-heptose 6-epimerase